MTSTTILLFPGQGAQHIGMGRDLFPRYRQVVEQCDDVLGYSLQCLCEDGPPDKLNDTYYTQPALYVVNALHYLRYLDEGGRPPVMAAGLSLGEYSALMAGNCFDLITGLRIVKRRGEVMAKIRSGGMAAVVGCSKIDLQRCLEAAGLSTLDIANENTFTQFVLAGPQDHLDSAKSAIESSLQATVVRLPVSGAFHSRYMQPAKVDFDAFLKKEHLRPTEFPVISNATARPHEHERISDRLGEQLVLPVRWTETIVYMLKCLDAPQFVELGPGRTLTGLTNSIQRQLKRRAVSTTSRSPSLSSDDSVAKQLGAATFRSRYSLKYSYVAGAMAYGISSGRFVARMAQAGVLSFLGTGGLSSEKITHELQQLRSLAAQGLSFGVNVIAGARETDTIDLLLKNDIRLIEASAFVDITLPIAKYRASGLSRRANGQVVIANRVIAKVSRPSVARHFMRPLPDQLLQKLLSLGEISNEQFAIAQSIPVADDICFEANSAGHTNAGASWIDLLPIFLRLRDEVMLACDYREPMHIGVAGGVGDPSSIAIAFLMGADFVLTGSINQCCVEANTSDLVKEMLSQADAFDTDYAPSADMFEIGAQVQVLKRGLLYPSRARKLLELYNCYDGWTTIPSDVRRQIEMSFFRQPFDSVVEQVLTRLREDEVKMMRTNERFRMAAVFKWYCARAAQLAQEGDASWKVDFQIWSGPAMGMFNRWAKDGPFEDWRARHADVLAEHLLIAAAERIKTMAYRLP